MGNQSVSQFTGAEAKKKFTLALLNDIAALQHMLDTGMVEAGITRIGAE